MCSHTRTIELKSSGNSYERTELVGSFIPCYILGWWWRCVVCWPTGLQFNQSLTTDAMPSIPKPGTTLLRCIVLLLLCVWLSFDIFSKVKKNANYALHIALRLLLFSFGTRTACMRALVHSNKCLFCQIFHKPLNRCLREDISVARTCIFNHFTVRGGQLWWRYQFYRLTSGSIRLRVF